MFELFLDCRTIFLEWIFEQIFIFVPSSKNGPSFFVRLLTIFLTYLTKVAQLGTLKQTVLFGHDLSGHAMSAAQAKQLLSATMHVAEFCIALHCLWARPAARGVPIWCKTQLSSTHNQFSGFSSISVSCYFSCQKSYNTDLHTCILFVKLQHSILNFLI